MSLIDNVDGIDTQDQHQTDEARVHHSKEPLQPSLFWILASQQSICGAAPAVHVNKTMINAALHLYCFLGPKYL